jgi:hypothetical protein
MPTRENSRTLTWIAISLTCFVLVLELLHKQGYADRLHDWAEHAAANAQAPNPFTFVSRAVDFFWTCFLKTNCSPDRPVYSREPCGHFITCVGLNTIGAINYAIEGTPHAGLLGGYTVAFVIVLSALIAVGIARKQEGGFIAWLIAFVLVALFGGGAFLWVVGGLLHLAYTTVGLVAAFVIFIAVNAIALHFSLLIFEGTVEVTTEKLR